MNTNGSFFQPFIFLLLALGILSCSKAQSNGELPVKTASLVDTPEINIPVPETDTLNLSVDDLLGRIDQSKDPRFIKIEDQYTNKKNVYLRKEAYQAFLEMRDAAAKEGIPLLIVSATRNFNYQKRIWENKWKGNWQVEGKNLATSIKDPLKRALTILRFSSMPGTSRHHWGTDIDLNSLSNTHFSSGKGKKMYEWMQAHAAEFGFCQTYTEKGEARPHGYQEEKWHWSFSPLSTQYLKAYQKLITANKITDFVGSETAAEIEVIEKYVGGINPACK